MPTPTAQEMLAKYLDAEVAVLAGKRVRFSDGQVDRELSSEDLQWIQAGRREWQRIVDAAAARFAIEHAACVHRVGLLEIGELAVWVGVSAGHRDAAFAACRWIIDQVKAHVPIWKNEHYSDGESGWLHPDNTPVQQGPSLR